MPPPPHKRLFVSPALLALPLAAGALLVGLAPPAMPQMGQHTHVWGETENNTPARLLKPVIQVGAGVAIVSAEGTPSYVSVGRMGMDTDVCTGTQGMCAFPNKIANDAAQTAEWSDGAAGGQFGKFVGEIFQTGVPANEVSHYRCPTTPGVVGLRVRAVDDPAEAWQPPNGPTVPTFNDNLPEEQAWSDPVQVTVWDIIQPVRPGVPPPPQPTKIAMPGGANPFHDLAVVASVPVNWGFMVGPFLGAWQGNPPPDPVAGKTLRIYTNGQYLPEQNSAFGSKSITATYAGSQIMRGFQLFYTKEAANHHPSSHPLGGQYAVDAGTDPVQPSRNWYYYWTQTSACQGFLDHHYNSQYPRSVTRFMGDWESNIGPLCGTGPLGTQGLGFGGATGIDLFAWTVRHEAQHLADFTADWGQTDPHPDPEPDPPVDADWDVLGDERNKVSEYHPEGYDPDEFATYPDDAYYGDGWSDSEDWCLHRQTQWANGAASGSDWSAGERSKQWP